MDYIELIKLAKQAKQNAYAPYSKFKVGCAILCENGEVVTGCNVENIAGSSNCAERTAIYSAISKGNSKIKTIAVIGSENNFCYPCGACRQVIIEHNENAMVVCAKNETEFEVYNIKELLPHAFYPTNLKKGWFKPFFK